MPVTVNGQKYPDEMIYQLNNNNNAGDESAWKQAKADYFQNHPYLANYVQNHPASIIWPRTLNELLRMNRIDSHQKQRQDKNHKAESQ
jgi:hypothetical protein